MKFLPLSYRRSRYLGCLPYDSADDSPVNILGISLKWRKQQKFRAEFARFLGTIRENTRWIDLEANIALHNLSHDLTSRGHREILASMSAMRTTSATSLPATGVTASTASYRMIPHLVKIGTFDPLFRSTCTVAVEISNRRVLPWPEGPGNLVKLCRAGDSIAIIALQRGIPSKRKSSACVDYVPALPPIATTD